MRHPDEKLQGLTFQSIRTFEEFVNKYKEYIEVFSITPHTFSALGHQVYTSLVLWFWSAEVFDKIQFEEPFI